MDSSIAIRMINITKTFGEVVANNKVCLDIHRGEILSLLGENGSGKTTLMNMLAGIYFPDEGEIYVNGVLTSIRSPKDAFSAESITKFPWSISRAAALSSATISPFLLPRLYEPAALKQSR